MHVTIPMVKNETTVTTTTHWLWEHLTNQIQVIKTSYFLFETLQKGCCKTVIHCFYPVSLLNRTRLRWKTERASAEIDTKDRAEGPQTGYETRHQGHRFSDQLLHHWMNCNVVPKASFTQQRVCLWCVANAMLYAMYKKKIEHSCLSVMEKRERKLKWVESEYLFH